MHPFCCRTGTGNSRVLAIFWFRKKSLRSCCPITACLRPYVEVPMFDLMDKRSARAAARSTGVRSIGLSGVLGELGKVARGVCIRLGGFTYPGNFLLVKRAVQLESTTWLPVSRGFRRRVQRSNLASHPTRLQVSRATLRTSS